MTKHHVDLGIVDQFVKSISQISCDDQFVIATRIAANVGYVLMPEPSPDGSSSLEDRVSMLEKIVDHICPDKSGDI